MFKTARVVSLALLASLTAASVCLAADSLSVVGMASMGGGLGISRFLADADYTMARDGGGSGRDVWSTRDAASRFAFAAELRYTLSRHWRIQVSPGFLWTGYQKDTRIPFRTTQFPTDSLKSDVLTLVLPVSFQLQWLQRSKHFLFHEGVGPGLYRVWVEQNRHVLEDPVSKKLHRGFYPGATAQVGVEYFLKSQPKVSLELAAASHIILAQRDEQFPSGFNSNVWTSEARFGANYHFDPKALRKPAGKTGDKK